MAKNRRKTIAPVSDAAQVGMEVSEGLSPEGKGGCSEQEGLELTPKPAGLPSIGQRVCSEEHLELPPEPEGLSRTR
ncbi:hypothetical protein ACP3TJ_01920 [Desulforudis sp. 1088]|uniref:hypothetical protein n=1 Tax=unclassified Candidatus Desulforudis TaxID=2635950 RepID=UPI00348545C7